MNTTTTKIAGEAMTDEQLKPCPFCGCTTSPELKGNGIGDNWLECVECGASTRLREDGAGSTKDWNRRALLASTAAVPEGWKLVPVELNADMLAALRAPVGSTEQRYRAMLAASPTAPAQSCGDAEQADETVTDETLAPLWDELRYANDQRGKFTEIINRLLAKEQPQ